MAKFYGYVKNGMDYEKMMWEAIVDDMVFGHTGDVQLILAQNDNVDLEEVHGDNEDTPLLFVTQHAKPCMNIVKALVEAGANVNAQDKDGYTPLHNAAHFCNKELVKYLVANGADIRVLNADGKYPKDVWNGHKKEQINKGA